MLKIPFSSVKVIIIKEFLLFFARKILNFAQQKCKATTPRTNVQRFGRKISTKKERRICGACRNLFDKAIAILVLVFFLIIKENKQIFYMANCMYIHCMLIGTKKKGGLYIVQGRTTLSTNKDMALFNTYIYYPKWQK